jgi:hypothetical protein
MINKLLKDQQGIVLDAKAKFERTKKLEGIICGSSRNESPGAEPGR